MFPLFVGGDLRLVLHQQRLWCHDRMEKDDRGSPNSPPCQTESSNFQMLQRVLSGQTRGTLYGLDGDSMRARILYLLLL